MNKGIEIKYKEVVAYITTNRGAIR